MRRKNEDQLTELTRIKPHEVSLVERPANRRRFLAFKSAEGGDVTMFGEETMKRADELGIDLEALSEVDQDKLQNLVDELESEKSDEPRKGLIRRLLNLVGGSTKSEDAEEDTAEEDDDQGNPGYVTQEELEERLAAEREKAAEEARKTATREAAVEQARKAVDAAVEAKRIAPGTADLLRPIAEKLAEDGHTITRKSEDGEQEVGSVEALIDAVASQGTISGDFFEEKSATGAGQDDNPWGEENFKG